MSKPRRYTRGVLLLARAIVAEGQTREDAYALLGISAGHLSHLLGGTRGVGLAVANRIKAIYSERGHEILTEAWNVDAAPEELHEIASLLDRIPRRPAPGAEVTS